MKHTAREDGGRDRERERKRERKRERRERESAREKGGDKEKERAKVRYSSVSDECKHMYLFPCLSRSLTTVHM